MMTESGVQSGEALLDDSPIDMEVDVQCRPAGECQANGDDTEEKWPDGIEVERMRMMEGEQASIKVELHGHPLWGDSCRHKDIDQGWAWAVLLASWMAQVYIQFIDRIITACLHI